MSNPHGPRRHRHLSPLALLGLALPAAAQTPPSVVALTSYDATSIRDGQHDFDFDLGTWKTHSSRLLRPLTGSATWTELDGVTVVSPVWGGRANLAEYKANGAGGSVELLSLRWYKPASHQWYLDFATPKGGALGIPNVGEFRNGRGDFYDVESIGGRTILLRFSIWRIDDDHAQSEQAFSDDGGHTWEINWINKYTRVAGTSTNGQ
jgi:hypothetical protein